MSFREEKRKAREKLHERLSLVALYLPPDGSGGFLDPIELPARVHYNMAPGFMSYRFSESDFSQRLEVEPKIIVMKEDLPNPQRNGVFSVEVGEAYQVESVEPVDDITFKLYVSRIPTDEALLLPTP
jgi:hypothetical protein